MIKYSIMYSLCRNYTLKFKLKTERKRKRHSTCTNLIFEAGNDSASETRVQRLLLNFSPIRARRSRCITQRPPSGKVPSSAPVSLSLSFPLSFSRSLVRRSKEIVQPNPPYVLRLQYARPNGSTSDFEITTALVSRIRRFLAFSYSCQ